ncbi:uncharacterized protein B0H64DRAFT_8935 [Chaetomium fimeti]|uniref:Secreted protein n=1 Tax=Chaetomium fimeti TaxID=1854472 RepID=A0AAE0HR05_9PEZI|nr:hypothetical protein B0H64DRAFT_8935 [Chaetomium fimeti]
MLFLALPCLALPCLALPCPSHTSPGARRQTRVPPFRSRFFLFSLGTQPAGAAPSQRPGITRWQQQPTSQQPRSEPESHASVAGLSLSLPVQSSRCQSSRLVVSPVVSLSVQSYRWFRTPSLPPRWAYGVRSVRLE